MSIANYALTGEYYPTNYWPPYYWPLGGIVEKVDVALSDHVVTLATLTGHLVTGVAGTDVAVVGIVLANQAATEVAGSDTAVTVVTLTDEVRD